MSSSVETTVATNTSTTSPANSITPPESTVTTNNNVSHNSAEIATTPAIDTSGGANSSNSSQKMNGLTLSELCCLFCCPPCPGRIAAKLAFLPPEPTYSVSPDPSNQAKCTLKLSERADWQYNQRDLDSFEVFYATSSRGNRIACKCDRIVCLFLFLLLWVRFPLLTYSDFFCYYHLQACTSALRRRPSLPFSSVTVTPSTWDR